MILMILLLPYSAYWIVHGCVHVLTFFENIDWWFEVHVFEPRQRSMKLLSGGIQKPIDEPAGSNLKSSSKFVKKKKRWVYWINEWFFIDCMRLNYLLLYGCVGFKERFDTLFAVYLIQSVYLHTTTPNYSIKDRERSQTSIIFGLEVSLTINLKMQLRWFAMRCSTCRPDWSDPRDRRLAKSDRLRSWNISFFSKMK
jgi:hypothetical protein